MSLLHAYKYISIHRRQVIKRVAPYQVFYKCLSEIAITFKYLSRFSYLVTSNQRVKNGLTKKLIVNFSNWERYFVNSVIFQGEWMTG